MATPPKPPTTPFNTSNIADYRLEALRLATGAIAASGSPMPSAILPLAKVMFDFIIQQDLTK